ncbi:MAG TPA: hypothetical protein VN581_11735 [Patescibacteria group bacterium]|nr:hypothetical protein [Patescibacteria group bacterium]
MTNSLALLSVWLGALALPVLLFLLGGAPATKIRGLLRAVAAIASGWVLMIAYAVVANAVAVATAERCDELLRVHDADGAPLAFAAVFGWVPAATCVAVIWGFRRLRRTR